MGELIDEAATICLKVVRHLENCKFTKLADAVGGTRTIWPADVDVQCYRNRA